MTLRLPIPFNGIWRREYPFSSRYLEIGAERIIHYVDEGQGPPVVMVHGNPSWSFMFRHLIKNLTGYRRLALDQIGMGLSSRPQLGYGYTLKERLEDFSLWLANLKLAEPIHLVVHDWGGPVGLGWAGANPDRVASLTIMNTGLKVPVGFSIPLKLAIFKMSTILGHFLATDLNLFTKGVVRYGSERPMSPEAKSGILAPYLVAAHRQSLPRWVADIPLNHKHQSFKTLALVNDRFERLAAKPTFLAWGLKDFVFSESFLEDFKRRRPRAMVLALPRAGHCLLEDEPEAILQGLSAFLDTVKH
jgi:haloalkane dehalogenase